MATIKDAPDVDIKGYLTGFSLNEKRDLFSFDALQSRTQVEWVEISGESYPRFVNEFWTAKQRQAAPLHEVAYRACFKPQLPRFFIELLTSPDDVVYDPFSGRGTTIIEAGLHGRNVIANDINPLSQILARPRLFIPDMHELARRLGAIPIEERINIGIDLSMFYHPTTLTEIASLRYYLLQKRNHNAEDQLDAWIRMVATNRLTGHSSGFFSVYTLPPNQAVSAKSQTKINEKRNQAPEYRDIKSIILRKPRQLITGLSQTQIANLKRAGQKARFLSRDARYTNDIEPETVHLTVTSPPFLDIVQYAQDNWLRCWFNGIDEKDISGKITIAKSLQEWTGVMSEVFRELYRITHHRGWVAFEVGEIRKGEIRLDEYVVPLGIQAGFECLGILVNQQEFTKTANIWGVKNNTSGTNSNRVVILNKP